MLLLYMMLITFLKSNIILSGNSRPTVNEEGYIEKRSIVGSIEWFEKQIKISDVSGQCQSIKFKERKQLETKNPWEEAKPNKKVTIQLQGIEEIKKEIERVKNGFNKNESTFIRK